MNSQKYRKLAKENKLPDWINRRQVFKKESLTVPNQAIDLNELLQRVSNGETIQRGKPTYFEENPDIDNVPVDQFTSLDLSEAYEMKQALEERIERSIRESSNKKPVEDVKTEPTIEGKTPEGEGGVGE